MEQEIILKDLEILPYKDNVDEELEWLSRSFGFVTTRDKDETAAKVLQAIVVQGLVKQQALSSEDIAERCDVTRAAVLHHLRNYISSGIIIPNKRTYVLRTKSMTRTIEEIELDALRIFAKLKRIAQTVDNELGLV